MSFRSANEASVFMFAVSPVINAPMFETSCPTIQQCVFALQSKRQTLQTSMGKSE